MLIRLLAFEARLSAQPCASSSTWCITTSMPYQSVITFKARLHELAVDIYDPHDLFKHVGITINERSTLKRPI